MPNVLRRCAGLLLVAGLAGCQLLPAPASPPAGKPVPAAASAPAKAPVLVSNWRASTLGDLLIAEVAGQRNQLDVAYTAYLQQARERRDPQLASRATRIAWYSRDSLRIMEAASLWVELAPEDPEANANAIVGLIQGGQIERAIPLLDRVLESRQSPLRFNYIVQYALESDPATRARVDQSLAELASRHPQVARLWLARAELAEADNEKARALDFVQRARQLEPRFPPSILLEGRLLSVNGQHREARRLLARGSRDFPRERELRLTYLQVLLEQGRGEDARGELEDMTRVWPEDGDIAFSLAMLEWETGNAEAAEQRLVALAEAGQREDDAWMYAGRIALARRDYTLAAQYFQNVGGAQFLQAQVQVALAWQKRDHLEDALELVRGLQARHPEGAGELYLAESELLARADRADEALAVLDSAINRMPGDDQLLYARALAAERVNRIDIAEADLRTILRHTPDNVLALNALGYTLADRTDRLAEAREYISRALLLAPEDPAILDSMGWVLFRLGQYEEAISWLRRAYAASRDGEIAAHLGEALWMAGHKREARRVWKRAQALEPDSIPLKRTLERLQP